MSKRPHLIGPADLLRIAKAVEWPIDTLENQVRYIQAVNVLETAMWGNLQPFEFWNRTPAALRNTVGFAFGEFLSTVKRVCEVWTLTAWNLEIFLGKPHPTGTN
jgi:hypothetical protein